MRSCLSVEELAAYADGVHTVPVDVVPHIDSCEACRQAIAAAVRGARSEGAGPTLRLGRGTQPPTGRRRDDYAALVTVDPQHYIIGEELARGGMGRILVARDRRIGRPVAIKELLVDSDDMRARFEREARITGRLQHPAIVSLLEAGTWPTGEPFYVMKLVTGESLDRAISRGATLEQRIGLLSNVVGVVEALAYAHDKRVIHRDLKPGNVLVGEFGETVVIDWGLAKDLADSGAADIATGPYRAATGAGQTVDGSVIGTPAYMPPEQARGEAVDERADVYALGAMLYHLLCGEPPYTGRTIEAIIFAVTEGPPQPLGDRTPGVPPDLVAIVAKAMAHAAADRYPTAKEMAVDLKKFQTGQLVGAHRYSAWQLVRRWIRRHRAAVAVAALAFAVVTALGIVSLQRIFAEQGRTEQQRQVAQKNRGDAEDLVRFMLIDLRDKLTPLGRMDLLGDASKRAVTYYEARTDLADDELQRFATARTNLGDVLMEQANTPDALREYRAALAIAETLVAKDPESENWQQSLAATYSKLGDVAGEQGDTTAALAHYRAALAVVVKLLAIDPHNVKFQRDASVLHRDLGDTLQERHDPSALTEYRTALASAAVYAATDPGNFLWQQDVVLAHNGVGDMLAAHGDSAGAIAEYQSAVTIAEANASAHPKDAFWKSSLTSSHGKLGDVLSDQGDLAGALAHYRAGIASGEALVEIDPTNMKPQQDIAMTRARVGDLLLARGDRAGALAEYRLYLTISETLAAKDPTIAFHQNELVSAHTKLGDLALAAGDASGALEQYRPALAIAERVEAKDATKADEQRQLLDAHGNLGLALLAKRDPKAALAEFRASLSVAEALAASDPSNVGSQSDLADTHLNIGDALAALGDKRSAHAEYEAALAISRNVEVADPSNADYKTRTAKLVGKLRN